MPASPLPAPAEGRTTVRIDTVARGLKVSWGLATLPDGRLLVTERNGQIRSVRDGVLDPMPWATVDVYARERGHGPETGLLGLAVAPDFATSGAVCVVATIWRSDGDRARAFGARLRRRLLGTRDATARLHYSNQVLRFTECKWRAGAPEVIVLELPTAFYHAGGGIGFGPDGMLYVSIGDAMIPARARRRSGWLGRIDRFTPDGAIPADNPVTANSTWAYGLRNAQAFDWTDAGAMVAIEHGPSGMV